MKQLLSRLANKDRLSYFMNIAFGISLLMVTLQFQFGKTTITTPSVIVHLDFGYITEPSQTIRVIEFILSIGLIVLGIERIYHHKKNNNAQNLTGCLSK